MNSTRKFQECEQFNKQLRLGLSLFQVISKIENAVNTTIENDYGEKDKDKLTKAVDHAQQEVRKRTCRAGEEGGGGGRRVSLILSLVSLDKNLRGIAISHQELPYTSFISIARSTVGSYLTVLQPPRKYGTLLPWPLYFCPNRRLVSHFLTLKNFNPVTSSIRPDFRRPIVAGLTDFHCISMVF